MKRYAMKYIQSLLIIILAVLCLYLYNERRTATESLNGKIAACEAANAKEREDYEIIVAYLKAEKERELAQERLNHRGSPTTLLDQIKKLPTAPKKVRSDALGEISQTLQLDEKQEMQVRTVIADFEKAKKRFFEKARAENRFIFDPIYVEKVNEVRGEAMGKMAGILSEEQLMAMKEKNFDLKLGIREMSAPKGNP